MELTKQSLEECLIKVRQATADRDGLIDRQPSYMFVHWDYLHWADRLLNPWKGKRAKWLTTKMGK